MANYFSATTFRQIGNGATTQNLFTIENGDPSVIVKVRRLVVQMDATAALTAVMPLIKTARTSGSTLPSGGTVLNKVLFDTNISSNANVVVRGSTASDGGANSGPTATPSDVMWQQFGMRLHTAVGQVLGPDNNMLPLLVDTQDLILRQNQALLVVVIAAATTSNPSTNHYFAQVVWQEV
jgi:hypothetical protein